MLIEMKGNGVALKTTIELSDQQKFKDRAKRVLNLANDFCTIATALGLHNFKLAITLMADADEIPGTENTPS